MGYPKICLTDETMREGMQIESAAISIEDKVALIDELSHTGLTELVIGYFASPRYTPQMKDVEEVIDRITPVPGVTYLAFAPNERGRARMAKHAPPLSLAKGKLERPRLSIRLSDTFERRNTNVDWNHQLERLETVRAKAVTEGRTEASIFLGDAWGSNFEGPVTDEERKEWLEYLHGLWDEVGIAVKGVGLVDSESWAMPHVVERNLRWIVDRWPEVEHFFFHIHNGRGTAMAQIYAIMTVLDERHHLHIESTVGGIGGCPYCGNGRATGMVATEDLVVLLEQMGVPTGVDIDRLVRFAWRLETLLGRPLMGHVSKCGWLPRDAHELYDPNLPLIETYEQARHFLLGKDVTRDCLSPWRQPIPPPARPYGGRVHPPASYEETRS